VRGGCERESRGPFMMTKGIIVAVAAFMFALTFGMPPR